LEVDFTHVLHEQREVVEPAPQIEDDVDRLMNDDRFVQVTGAARRPIISGSGLLTVPRSASAPPAAPNNVPRRPRLRSSPYASISVPAPVAPACIIGGQVPFALRRRPRPCRAGVSCGDEWRSIRSTTWSTPGTDFIDRMRADASSARI